MTKYAWYEDQLKVLQETGLFNTILEIQSPIGARIKINGKEVLNFCTNNYLGLANDTRLKLAAKKAIDTYGVGPAAVRSIAGTTSLHNVLEKKLAEFKKCEDVITLQSGFTANLGTIPALVGEGDAIFSDELNHASIIDGCRLSKATIIAFKHADPADLEEKIKANVGFTKKIIITDGVFSMDGDIAPLDKLYPIAEKYDCLLMVDDAHGEGVLGDHGRGIVDHYHLHGKVDVEIGTLSKAFGVVGGFVAGKKLLIDWLRQRCRPFLFSSALPLADVAACIEAVSILEESDDLVKRLWENANYLQKGLKDMKFDVGRSMTPIVPVMLGDEKLAQKFSKALFDNGLFAKAIAYPTVARGKARIRVMNSAAHNTKDLDEALNIFKQVGKDLNVI